MNRQRYLEHNKKFNIIRILKLEMIKKISFVLAHFLSSSCVFMTDLYIIERETIKPKRLEWIFDFL